MFTRYRRAIVTFKGGEAERECNILAGPGEVATVYGNAQVMPEGFCRVWWTVGGYGFEATVALDRLKPWPAS